MEVLGPADRASTEAVDGVHLALLAGGDEMNVQRFEIEPGATVPEHDHPHEQTGVVLSGTLTFVLADGTEHEVDSGDTYAIPGHEAHAAENRTDAVVTGIDVFSPPRTDPDWQDG
ncbi:cupin domain-containing protein [Natranaeroarchaeum aerophilus]|uniref:Cupin domain-containing protein n=1 Tax=Natranaeroarchaeum aerophilus TaxID=2917711 RepID=A0AAE3FPF3_9EURY|nr:cupin domain-containing protein [Natranaeroarchaeum aerophilus]MCL9812706.1 cupin domain-containing protein [Natranaeroarchaeum aerophilus]